MTDELYLILHKVRGEPAFDIAQKIEIGKEEGWIIPTSGHRAYPLTWTSLTTLNMSLDGVDIPPDHPDHYNPKRDDNAHLIDAAREILTRKGLISAAKPSQPIYRRV